jgi:D-sedoheptulose 7-phosphate isomerase
LLFFTGITRKADSILGEQKSNIKDRSTILRGMKILTYMARDVLKSGNLDDFGRLLNENWQLKKRMASGISNGEIDDLYHRAIAAGALGGKITGAGGGGFLLLYCPKRHQDNLRRELHSLRELPFQLERDGSKVIFNYRRSYAGAPTTEREERTVFPVQLYLDGSNSSQSSTSPAQPNPISVEATDRESGGYVQGVQDVLSRLREEPIHQLIQILHEARTNHRQVILLGNGGSASTASHFACDLSKNARCDGWPDFRVISLGDNLAVLTAYANDEGYENIFVKQLASLILPDDVVIGISTSGNSENVLRALEFAREAKATTVGLTGFDGGALKDLVDIHIHVPSDCIEHVEDVHLMIEHMVTKTLRERARVHTQPGLLESTAGDMQERSLPVVETDERRTSSVSDQGMSHGKADPIDVLFRINQLLISHVDIRLILREVLQVVTEGLDAASGSVLILDESGDLMNGEVSYGGTVSSREPEELHEIFSQGLASWVIQNRQGVLVEDTREDSRWVQRTWGQEREPPRSAISVPLVFEDKPRAVLTLANPELKRFTKGDLDTLSAIALCIMMKAFIQG